MATIDFVVLGVYFGVLALIGIFCMFRIKAQEDFFLGSRSFGKLLQTFAAFGAGTGSNEPVTVGRTTWTSGLAGIWGVLMWLFVTPFYWIFGTWYRRMRHMTIGDWFTERYDSKSLGAAYCVFGIVFYMMYLSTMFTAMTKVAAPLLNVDVVQVPGVSEAVGLEYVLVPAISLMVIVYGILGGLKAAYWTDLIQGFGIILLSIILIPTGLSMLIERFPESATSETGMIRGFEIMHERMPAEYFQIFGGPLSSEFPLHFIVSLTLLGLVGIVVQPHFIATGGGSAKDENSARIGLVAGNFLKRACTIGWALTGLIVLCLLVGHPELTRDPDRVWGVASREILGPMNLGLVGLMLACLLAALMSSADTYMIMVAGLVTRNLYAPLRPVASEREYLAIGRAAGLVMIIGAALVSMYLMDVFGQFVLALKLPIVFAAAFWLGMWWRRANKWSAWFSLVFSITLFFAIPLIPKVAPDFAPSFMHHPRYAIRSDLVTTVIERPATEVDVARREVWDSMHAEALALEDPEAREAAVADLGAPPPSAQIGQMIEEVFRSGGDPIFWETLEPVGEVQLEEVRREESADGTRTIVVERHRGAHRGSGTFQLDMMIYPLLGVDLATKDKAMLATLDLPPKLILPFAVMILVSLITPRTRREVLDRYYTKMKVPVLADREADAAQLAEAYQHPEQFESRKIFPGSSLEIQRPRWSDSVGFVACFGICFLIVWITVWITQIGAR